jgi:histidine ammonia-lyase
MGANAATKAYEIVQNLYSILAIELMTASQALEFRRPSRTSSYLEDWIHNFRKNVPFIDQDRVLHEDIEKSEAFLRKATI